LLVLAEKAVRRYAEAQEKKWRRWSEALFAKDPDLTGRDSGGINNNEPGFFRYVSLARPSAKSL